MDDVQRGPAKKWLSFFLPAAAGLLACFASGCGEDAPPSRAELDAMSALQRVRGHIQCDPEGHAVCVDFARVDDLRDDDLGPLAQLPYTERIKFDDSPIGDAGLAPLAGLKHLKELSLRGTKITDAGLVHLQKLPALTELDLERLPITDAGLPALGPIKSLRRVYVGPGGPITTAGVEALKAVNPKVNVSRK
jgi:hypothetical protein